MKSIGFIVLAVLVIARGAAAQQDLVKQMRGQQAAKQRPVTPSVQCTDDAQENPAFNHDSAEEFCRGAGSSDPLKCYRAANNSNLFIFNDKETVFQFCKTSGTLGRMDCFNEALKTFSSEKSALKFCEHAADAAPVECYIDARDKARARIPFSVPEEEPYSRAFEFCAGSGSKGRVGCYNEALNLFRAEEDGIAVDKALFLCKDQQDSKNVRCYEDFIVHNDPKGAFKHCAGREFAQAAPTK